MNWSRGKNRLIILFLCINLLLGWANYRKDATAYTLKDTQVEDIRIVLEQNNIFLDTSIPKKYKPLPKLTVFPYQINSSIREDFVRKLLGTLEGAKVSIEAAQSPGEKPRRIYSREDEQVVFEGENILYYNSENNIEHEMGVSDGLSTDQAIEVSKDWLIEMDYSPRKKHMQVVEEPSNINIIYYDKYDGTPIFDSYIKFKITSLGVKEIEIHKVELGESAGGKQEIYSADQVFFYLMNLIDSDQPTHIKDIMIGYALENPKGTHLIAEKALPFYQIILENGKTYYINAYTSEIREEGQI